LRPFIPIATFATCFVLSAAGSVHAQQPQPVLPEKRSPFSEIAHDFTTWLTHVTGSGTNDHRRASPPPLPRPRPAELAPTRVTSNKQPAEVAPAPLVSEKQSLEVAPTSVAPKKETLAPVLIND
jgi:hypothetical protein